MKKEKKGKEKRKRDRRRDDRRKGRKERFAGNDRRQETGRRIEHRRDNLNGDTGERDWHSSTGDDI